MTELKLKSADELLSPTAKNKNIAVFGPSIHVIVSDTSRFVGNGTTLGFGMGNNGPGLGAGFTDIDGNIISKKEMEFCSGLEYSNVTDEKFKPLFRDLDVDNSDDISPEDIEAYRKYCEQKKEYEKYVKDSPMSLRKAIIGTGISGVSTAFGICNTVREFSDGCVGKGVFGSILSLGALGLTIWSGLNIKKAKLNEDRMPADEKFPDVVKGNEQYKHINAAQVEYRNL